MERLLSSRPPANGSNAPSHRLEEAEANLRAASAPALRPSVASPLVLQASPSDRWAMFLDRDELAQLTSRRRRNAQVHMLRAMGIEHRVRPDGSVAVLRAHVEQTFGLEPSAKHHEQNTEPDWSAI